MNCYRQLRVISFNVSRVFLGIWNILEKVVKESPLINTKQSFDQKYNRFAYNFLNFQL